MAMTFKNPVAHGMKYSAQNIDSHVRSAVAEVDVTNGMLVTLDGFADMPGYVFKATPTTADTAVDVWMVREPEVPKNVRENMFIDPRAFSVEKGKVFDVIKLEAGDVIKMSKGCFSTVPAATSTTWAYPAANGQTEANASASGKTGLVMKLLREEKYSIGQEFEDAYIMEVIQNPTKALA